MRPAVSIALLLLSACSIPLRTAVPPDQLALRRPENRAGALVEGELVRATWLPELESSPAVWAADPSGFAGIHGAPRRWLVVSKAEGGRAVLTFAGPPQAWRQGLLGMQGDLWPALTAARDASPFHAPVETRLGSAPIWAVGDLVPEAVLRPGGESLTTVELYPADPRRGARQPVTPDAVLVVARRAANGQEVRRGPGELGLISRPDGFFRVARLEHGAEGRLTALEFAPWRPEVPAILGGLTAVDVLGAGHPRELAMERLLTDTLLEWKTRTLPGWLAEASPAAMEDAVISTEKGMLQLDLKSRVVKDSIDASAREGAGSQAELTEKAQVLDQRKTLVAVVLGSLKAARAAAR